MMGSEDDEQLVRVKELPPGFRFDPTDEELVLHFLYSKAASLPLVSHHFIPELDDFFHTYFHPSQLDGEALESYGKWYFFTRKTENRMTKNGYWKDVDMDQPIFTRSTSNNLVGFKKHFVFYKGKFPSGVKSEWLLHEFHLCTNNLSGDQIPKRRRRMLQPDVNKWVLCQVQVSNCSNLMNIIDQDNNSSEGDLSSLDELFLAVEEDQDEISYPFVGH